MEISPLFLGFVDNDVVPPRPLFFCLPSFITPSSTLYVSYSTYLASSATVWVYNMLHFVIAFAIAIAMT